MEIYFKKIKKDKYYVTSTNLKFCRPLAMHEADGDLAVIDVDMVFKSSQKHNIDFDLLLSTCISHELIHSLLEREFNLDISHQFDDMYHRFKKEKSPFHILGTGF